MDEDKCLFCQIIKKEMPTKFVHEDSEVVVFSDIKPKARVHLLVVPREHINTFLDLGDNHFLLLTKMVKVVQRIIEDQKLQGGFQLIFNGGKYQHVPHLHWHLLGD